MSLLDRRTFLGNASLGMGSIALAGMMADESRAAATSRSQGLINPLHVAAKAKRVIFLCMSGGPSHLELFDEKPTLAKLDGQPIPGSFTAGQPIAQLQGQQLNCWGPQAKFANYGNSGQRMSNMLPEMAKLADEFCIIRSMQTEQINHDPAHTFMNTGTAISGRPSMGAWINYGLGSECEDLPGFVVMVSHAGRPPQPISSRQWHCGFLPGQHQGVRFHSTGDPVHYVSNPPGVSRNDQLAIISTTGALNRLRDAEEKNPEIAARIAQYELAYRMQMSVPKLTDIRDEPQHILDAYGVTGPDGSFGYNCLLARRLAERGVRFIHLYHREWDHHGDLNKFLKISCDSADRPTAALLTDLKNRGLLEDTLVVWGGEFGRTPMAQGDKGATKGRDHHIRGFSMLLAGGGVKPGISHGETDELGYYAVKDKVHVNDLHATMLHLLGVDHKRLTYRYQGRDFRLTDVAGKVVKEILL